MADRVPVYRGLEESDRQRLIRDVRVAYEIAAAQPVEEGADPEGEEVGPTGLEPVRIPEFEELVGIDAGVYRQINAALAVGKQHLMFYGPPGTGKTTLGRWRNALEDGGFASKSRRSTCAARGRDSRSRITRVIERGACARPAAGTTGYLIPACCGTRPTLSPCPPTAVARDRVEERANTQNDA